MSTIKATTLKHESATSGITMDASGNATLTGNVSAADVTASGDLTVDTDTLKVDSTNDRVGINKASPTEALDVNGTVKATSFSGSGASLTGLTSLYKAKGSRTFTHTDGALSGTTTITQSPGAYDAYIEGNIAVQYKSTTIQAADDVRFRLRLKDTWVSISTQQVQGVQFADGEASYNVGRETWPGNGNYGMLSLAGIPFRHQYYPTTGTSNGEAIASRIFYEWNGLFSSETGSLASVKDETYNDVDAWQGNVLLFTYRGFCASGGTFEFLAENASGSAIGTDGSYSIFSYEL